MQAFFRVTAPFVDPYSGRLFGFVGPRRNRNATRGKDDPREEAHWVVRMTVPPR
jgi:hypothetical protein